MGERYCHFDLEERCRVAELHRSGASLRQIAAALGRSPSSVSRELSRNRSTQTGYRPGHADDRAWARRWSGSRLDRDAALREGVLDRLRAGWSPEQVAGRLALEAGHPVISHETIYRFVYAQIRRTDDFRWRHYLPRAKSRRGRRGKPGGSPASFIKARRPLAERPADANDRQTPGHWEADFMLFATYGQSILVAHERHTRLTLAIQPPDRRAEPTAQALASLLAPLAPNLRRSVTFDNVLCWEAAAGFGQQASMRQLTPTLDAI